MLLSSGKVSHPTLVKNMFIYLRDYNQPLPEEGIVFTIEMTHDKKFSEYNNYYRKYCPELEYFDDDKINNIGL